MANATYIKETTDLKTAATAAYVTAGSPSRPEESGLGQRRGSEPGTGVYPRKKIQAPQMPGHLTDLIVDYIVQNATSVTALFHAWDKNHDGLIDKVEFRTFLNGVGFIVPREASDAMFDTFDDDGSGGLDYSELVRKSRKLAFERGKNMKDKPKDKPSLSRFNEKWTEKNVAHEKAFTKSVQKRILQQAARAEAEVAVRRAAQLEVRRERRDEARVRGTEGKEPYRLRQMKDDRWDAHTERLWEEASAQDVFFTDKRLNARVLLSEPSQSMRRCQIEERTPLHTRERPHSRKEALREVHTLPGYEDEVDSD